jgi:hypothetical protein
MSEKVKGCRKSNFVMSGNVIIAGFFVCFEAASFSCFRPWLIQGILLFGFI